MAKCQRSVLTLFSLKILDYADSGNKNKYKGQAQDPDGRSRRRNRTPTPGKIGVCMHTALEVQNAQQNKIIVRHFKPWTPSLIMRRMVHCIQRGTAQQNKIIVRHLFKNTKQLQIKYTRCTQIILNIAEYYSKSEQIKRLKT